MQGLRARGTESLCDQVRLGLRQIAACFADRIAREAIRFGLLGRRNRLPGVAHFLDGGIQRAGRQDRRGQHDCRVSITASAPKHLGYSFAMKARIYHNPRCSKSRATLELLEERGLDVEIVEYLRTPPDAAGIGRLLKALSLDAADIVRTGEQAFRDSGLTLASPPAELIALMAREPIVIERPIVVVGDRARIGRPPEKVLELVA